MNQEVNVWEEILVIPTYQAGKPEKNPMFLEKRIYQGSSGVVYPHPVIEKISDIKTDKAYKAVFLENDYIKIMVMPELGGRIQMAYDKIKERHFIYYNSVIKPALVGLTGPWISGGIEFNWPQHHRPSTFEPVDYTIEAHKDGSKTIWVNEVERMFRTKGIAGFTVYPDKAYIEIKGKLYNRTPFSQSFLWWANPAVKVNDDYQSIFPPDVYAVFDHGKRDVSSFPVAKGVYYKVDYAPGTDISRYKNIPVPTSYMAIRSKYNFIGGYEHDTQAGLLHVANHHISPGKKQWTWGHGAFGQAWDKNLTDEDGPYIELMTGIFTDNQPDFSWLQPYEEKTFTQYFMPYSEVGIVKNATKMAVLGAVYSGREIDLKIYFTSKYPSVQVLLLKGQSEIYKEAIAASPSAPYLKKIKSVEDFLIDDLRILVSDLESGKLLVSFQQDKPVEVTIPAPAQAAKLPADLENNEQLYLTGLHLEQYRHATYSAKDYYEEALRRDEKDVRCNNALGVWYLRRGKFFKAEPYFRKAIETLTQRNPNPYDGEPFFNLGYCLKLQNKTDEAFDVFFKSVWNDAWQHAGYFQLAAIAASRNNYEEAYELIEKSLVKNHHSHSARHLKSIIFRKMEMHDKAFPFIEESLLLDHFNFGCLFEKFLLFKKENKIAEADLIKESLLQLSHKWVHNFIEYALDYAQAGLYDEASELLLIYEERCESYPMIYYCLGWLVFKDNRNEEAVKYFKQAASANSDFCFPNRIEDVAILQTAMTLNVSDSKAPYYLGNFWYDKRQYQEAIECWEKSAALDNTFPTVYRNLSLAYFNKLNEPDRALASMEKAFDLDKTDARVLMELDQLYKKLNTSHTQRLEFLEAHLPLIMLREDLYLERITLYNQLEKYEVAKDLLSSFKFHPWEGGEGKVLGQHLICHIELAKIAIADGDTSEALTLLKDAENYPENLGEGKLYGTQENDIHYLKGLAYEFSGEKEAATESFKKATKGISEPVQALFYNDPQPDKIFYQGLAWMKLGNNNLAFEIFDKLISFGISHMNDNINIDYFAVSLPDLMVFDADLNLRNKIHCLYLKALGTLGLSFDTLESTGMLFEEVLALDINHQGASIHKHMGYFLKKPHNNLLDFH